MKNIWKMRTFKLYSMLISASLLVASCTQVYFEKPVPEQGLAMQTIPADWAGVYVAEPEDGETLSLEEQVFPQFFRFETVSETQLLVSMEYRVHEKDLPRLREILDEKIAEGAMIDYRLTENMILCRIANGNGEIDQQYTALLKTGPWYILTQTITPFQFFDLKAGIRTKFELNKHADISTPWLPFADSLTAENETLVARQTRKAWYFNTRAAAEQKWSLIYVEKLGKTRLLVKQSNLENPDTFKKRLDYFNSITSFREVESDRYEIDPSDKALEQLLAEEGFFQTTVLRRIAEED